MTYNLPVVNGLIFIGFLAVSAGFFAAAFRLKSRKTAAMVGMLFAVFPTVTATLFFRYTAPFYGVGVLLAVLAAWVLGRKRYGLFLSAIFTALSMGIYQAYAPITISMFVLLLIQQSLEGKTNFWRLLRKGLYDCAALLLGVVFYFLALKLLMAVTGEVLTDYRGVENRGQSALADVPNLLWQAFRPFCLLPFRDYAGLAPRKLLQLTYLVLAAVTVMMIGFLLVVKVRKISIAVMTGILCLVFPVAVNFIVIMCPDNWIYTLMVYPFVVAVCAPVILCEQMPLMEGLRGRVKKGITGVIGVVTAFLIFAYGYYDNVNYSALYYANRQVENYVSSKVTQIRMTEGFDTEKEWAFLGDLQDPLLSCPWEEGAFYGGSGFTEYLFNQYSRMGWFQTYIGYDVPLASEEKIVQLIQLEEVRQMPCWPNQGSIQVIGDTVVIKFQDLS